MANPLRCPVSPSAQPGQPIAELASREVRVYKSPTCGCCDKWNEHLEAAGFTVVVDESTDLFEAKRSLGVPAALASCHTAVVDDYVIEGHVPVDLVERLLEERPDIVGLAVPGMPIGSPGMEQGSRKDPYDVIAFDRSGRTQVYDSR